MNTKLPLFVLAVAAASQIGATDCGQIIRDPGFDLWCGNTLCAWKVERGTVAEVPTWNEGDPGVQLLGSNTAIEQLTPVTSTDTTCISFDLLTNIDVDAEVTLDIDLNGDGSVEKSVLLPAASWKPFSLLFAIQGNYTGIRFELTKAGDGSAVLADIGAQTATDCDASLPPIIPEPGPLGAACGSNADCTSGICSGASGACAGPACGTCAGCNVGENGCGSGAVCGVGVAFSPVDQVPFACVVDGSKPLGELCVLGTECASGICAATGACSTCDTETHPCAGSATCGPAWNHVDSPLECDAGAHAGSAGAPCALNADCASSQCNGAVYRQCDDGRPCATANDCPIDSTLINGECTAVGIVGGTCE